GSGMQEGLIHYLHAKKYVGEMIWMGYIFGGIGILARAWHLWGSHEEGDLDYYLSALGGALFILIVAMLIRWYLAPYVAVLSKAMGPVMGAKHLHTVLGLNYVVLGIVAGMVIVNTMGIPQWAKNGVRLSRLGLKTGVILLGTLYSFAELAQLGKLSVVLIGIFVLGSVGLVLLFGRMRNLPNSMTGVLSAGMGVCGVSATVAAAPVVKAKAVEIAYTIGTILLWGVGCMFLFPVVGHVLDLGHIQFGAWVGTGILNSAQVAGAALAFQPDGIETLKVAEIFNITRVLFLPIIVLWLAIWFVKREEGESESVNVGQVVIQKFPVFVLGFILMFALSSTGLFAPADHYKGKFFNNDIKESKMLTVEQVAVLKAEASKVTKPDQVAALALLIENRKIMSRDDDAVIRGLNNSKVMSKEAGKILKVAHKAVRHTAAKIKKFRQWITLLFAFGLTGLGMQITFAAIKQAGGQPLIIGGVVGTLKAVLSLIVILIFVQETI
ncbi:MAG: putative sulfate exporter family transporter, partial [Gammaproteobacteria bacterium]|nr:putative sulfate exporter family transporter [Gammaproteobacteria bacterium]